jgi:hypothetical protein
MRRAMSSSNFIKTDVWNVSIGNGPVTAMGGSGGIGLYAQDKNDN